MIPETRYVRTADGVHIAYQIVGDGPSDVLWPLPFASHIEEQWELPDAARFCRELGTLGDPEFLELQVLSVAPSFAGVANIVGAGEVLVSSTVKDLVAGSGLVFEDRGDHELKGVPDRWHLCPVVGS